MPVIDLVSTTDSEDDNNQEEFKYPPPPEYDFVPLSQVPSDVESAEDECLAHTASVIQKRIARRKEGVVSKLDCKKNDAVASKRRKKPKKKRGNGWSQRGSKKSRRIARERTKNQRFYVVVKGWKPGIYLVRKNATAQLKNYDDASMQTFKDESKARAYYEAHRTFPPGEYTPFPPAPDTPSPPLPDKEFIYKHHIQEATRSEPAVRAPPTHEQLMTMPRIADGPTSVDTRRIIERISSLQSNRVLDGSCCGAYNCPYSRGSLKEQRFLMLQRVYQINCVLSDLRKRGLDPST